jgi:hypothetical protein
VSWTLRSHDLSTDSILPPATRKRVSFGGPSTWRLHSNVPKYEVAGVPGGLQSRRHAAGCHLVQGRIRGRNQCGNSELSVLNGVSPFDTLILGMGNGHVHRGERVDVWTARATQRCTPASRSTGKPSTRSRTCLRAGRQSTVQIDCRPSPVPTPGTETDTQPSPGHSGKTVGDSQKCGLCLNRGALPGSGICSSCAAATKAAS